MIVSSDKLPPEHDATQRYRNATSGNVFSTRHHGTIQIRLWADGEVWVYSEDSATKIFRLPPLSQYGLALSA